MAAKFRVKTRIDHDGKVYRPGDTIELTDEQAAAMPWAIEPVPLTPRAQRAEEEAS